MNGFIARRFGLGIVLGTLMAGMGCHSTGPYTGPRYYDMVDECYPQRYNAAARAEVVSFFAPQVQNGHVLDQTLFNWHFEEGLAELNPAGKEKLEYLVRRRPCPDPRVFLQTAHDLPYLHTAPEEYADQRDDLDRRRVYSVQMFLQVQTATRPMPFEVVVHDPTPVGVSGQEASLYLLQNRFSVLGSLGMGAGMGGGGGMGMGGMGMGGMGGGGMGGMGGGGMGGGGMGGGNFR